MTKPNVGLIDKLVEFQDGMHNEGLIIKHTQEIPDEHLAALQLERAESLSTPAGNFHRVCSVPTGVIDDWKLQGFDALNAPIQDVLKRLRKHELDKFITSNKRI